MPVDISERYRLAVGQYKLAADIRVKIIQGCGLIYVGLALAFAWAQRGPAHLSWMVTTAGIVATILMWLAEKRNRSALGDAKEVVAAIEEAEPEPIPQKQRLFGEQRERPRWLPHGILIDITAALVTAFLLYATGYLWCSKGSL
jgi:hypothetical protein